MKNIIDFKAENKDAIIWISDEFQVDKNTTISVPINHKALALMNEKIAFRIEPCNKQNLLKAYDKTLNGEYLKLVYILTNSLPQMAWGFGNVQVNNERLKEAYRVGINGKYEVEVIDYMKLLKSFPNLKEISSDAIRERTISIVKSAGVPILSKCFANTNISVFEIDSLLPEIKENIKNVLFEESGFEEIGIKLKSLTVDGVHVNEEDLQIIRDRINN